MEKERLLVIDDNEKICSLIKKFGESQFEYKIDVAHNVSEALNLIKLNNYVLITLDIELEEENGLEKIGDIKAVFNGPILFVSCLADTANIIEGFNKGADDYITKPFDIDELFIRIKRSIDRSTSYDLIKVADYKIDEFKIQVYKEDKLLDLSENATKILIILLKNKNETITREEIFANVWHSQYKFSSRVIDTHMSYIRKETNDIRIRSVRSKGYIFETA